ncbi:MAG: hypothetical protein JWN60_3160 [Acidobacteria bacterium]|jgi:hypothetical protein|nr:hypothetical protein [Acidobacteriota bacterium]
MRTIFSALVFTFIFGGFVSIYGQTSSQVKLLINKQKIVTKDKLTIKFASLVEDSRCPVDTNCIWAGNAKIQIKISSAKNAAKTFELNTNLNPQIVSFAGYEIKLVNLTPQPASNIRINRNGYAATLAVSKSANSK